MENPGSKFLHDQNPKLHTTPAVEHTAAYLRADGEKIPNEPISKIEAYMGFLANPDYVNDGILTGDQESIDRQVETHVIKPENVPEGYFELQRRIAREQGHGNVEITEDLRHQLVEAAQTDQRTGLENWVEYLGGDDGAYPDWFKQYAWTSVTKLGTYDKEKHQFQKRTKSTVAPYPELNREALAYTYDKIAMSRAEDAVITEEVHDDKLQQLLQHGNFGKLYAHAMLEVTPDSPELRENIDGSWKKFDQTSDPRTARRLAESLETHGTGWCTAGKSTAQAQLKGGDFYVYYSKDAKDNDTIPRVAIRMEGGIVTEVRGINSDQEIEPIMLDIAAEKIAELPGGKEYTQKFEDMKLLTIIDKKTSSDDRFGLDNAELSKDEIRFLYELDHTIEGFGYRRDPRIHEIRQRRFVYEDLEKALEIPRRAISTHQEDALLDEGIVFHYGDMKLSHLTTAEGLQLPETISGSLDLSGLTTAEGLRLPKAVGGLNLGSLTTAEGLQLPETIRGGINFQSLKMAQGLKIPEDTVGGFNLPNLTTAEGIEFPETVTGELYLDSLATTKGLKLPKTIGGSLYLSSLTTDEGLQLPENIGDSLFLNSLTAADGLEFPETISGDLQLRALLSAEGLILPKAVGGDLYLNHLESVDKLNLPETVGHTVYVKPNVFQELRKRYSKNEVQLEPW